MVRYPKKTVAYQPVAVPADKPVTPPVEPKVITPRPVEDVKVQQLNEHIRVLEEKLKAIEVNVASRATSQQPPKVQKQTKGVGFSFRKRYWFVLVILLLIYPVFLGVNQWMNPAYTATTGFFVSASDVKVSGLDLFVPIAVQEKIIHSDNMVAKAWARVARWPGWMMRPLVWFYQKRITIDKHPSAAGFVINVQDNFLEQSRAFATAITAEFKLQYAKERQARLRAALNNTISQAEDHHKRLEKILTSLRTYNQQEQCIIVSAGVKKSLDMIATTRALELEQDYARVKEQSQSFPFKGFSDEKQIDRVAFYGLLTRLVDMELKKYLVMSDATSTYEGGLQPTKAKIANMINAYVANNASEDANVLIKSVFVKAKYDALDALLNKRYGPMSSFTGRMAEFSGLQAEHVKRFGLLENALAIKEQLDRLLKQDLSTEVVVDMPVIVMKK